MGQNDGVDGPVVRERRLPISFAKLTTTLKQAAVDHDLRAAISEKISRAGHRTRRPEKLDRDFLASVPFARAAEWRSPFPCLQRLYPAC